MGADIIVHPSNLVAAKAVWGPSMGMRALENNVHIVTANRTGSETVGVETLEFTGGSQIVAMNGQVICTAGPMSTEVLVAEVDPVATRSKRVNALNDLFEDRRPEMYS